MFNKKDNNEELSVLVSELKSEILKLKKELKTKSKYGLTFDRKTEKVVDDCDTKLPVLKEVVGKKIETDKNCPTNIIIEGDNYHSLQVLNYTHQGKIDVIYIDPPYNTGNKDFIYNDIIVDKEDGFSHSKWLSFMERRLLLSRDLLSENGVIFISIDDNEMVQLKMLCDAIFGENNFIQNFMWLHGKGKKDKNSRTLQQYILCYSKCKEKVSPWSIIKGKNYKFTNPDNDPEGPWFSGSISFSEDRSNKRHENFFSITSPSGKVWSRQWMCSREDMLDYIARNKIYWGDAPEFENVPRLKIRPSDEEELIPENIIDSVGTTKSAENDLAELFGGVKVFDYPKPYQLILHLVKLSSQTSSTILDFFAGSGTTGHAVLELNKEDGGNRQFLLCTNNGDEKSEHKIASDICYPRVQKIMEGYINKKKEKTIGLGGNLRYLKTAFIDKKKNKDEMKFKITSASTEILCLKEGVFDVVDEVGDDYAPIYKIVRGNTQNGPKVMGIYFNVDDQKLDEMRKKLLKYEEDKIAYIFALTDDSLDTNHNDWLQIKIEPIPEKILKVYEYVYKLSKK